MAILAIHAILAGWEAFHLSPSKDELAHVASGLCHWRLGRFEFYRVNPPLPRMLCTLPLLFLTSPSPSQPIDPEADARPEWQAARDLVHEQGRYVFRLVAIARVASIGASLLGAGVCFRWGQHQFGAPGGLVSAWLWCFFPMMVGCAAMVTPDIWACTFGLLAAYSFWRWRHQPTFGRAAWAGVALGLAELAKTTWIILFALWPLLWYLAPRTGAAKPDLRSLSQLMAIMVIGLTCLNAGYGFQNSGRPLREFHFVSQTLSNAVEPPTPSVTNRTSHSWLHAVPVPVPADYLLGIDLQKKDFESGFWSYLFGEFRQSGWWYYYLVGIQVKTPLGCLFIVLLATLWTLGRCEMMTRDAEVLMTGLSVLFFVSSQTGFTHHVRYVLPAMPFAFVWAARALAVDTPRWIRWSALAGMAWALVVTFGSVPFSLEYFNELGGGPSRAHHIMGVAPASSDLSWGRDLLVLRTWIDRHPGPPIRGLTCDSEQHLLEAIGLAYPAPPKHPSPGRYIVGVKSLYGLEDDYYYFRSLRPTAYIGPSLCVFDLSVADAERLRSVNSPAP